MSKPNQGLDGCFSCGSLVRRCKGRNWGNRQGGIRERLLGNFENEEIIICFGRPSEGKIFPRCACGFCCTCVCSVVFPLCSCNPAPVLRAARPKSSAGEGVGIATDPPPTPPRRRSSEPGALMFQHADVGKCPAGPVVVPESLVLPLQSPGAAAHRRHAAAGAGADRAAVLEHADLQLGAPLRVSRDKSK